MAHTKKRRDNKGRILKEGETQRANGLYQYSYTALGTRRCIYSWKLNETDSLPQGKRACKALRTMEDEINLDLLNGIDRSGRTLNEVFDISLEYWGKAKESTRKEYLYQYNLYIRKSIGNMNINNIDAFVIHRFNKELKEKGLSDSTIKRINALMGRAFSYAVSKKLIKDNPLKDIDIEINDAREVRALTEKEVTALLEYIKNSPFKYWLNLIVFLLETGVRIGEAGAITWKDIDWDEKEIIINKTLIETRDENGKVYLDIGTTKSKRSQRIIPMTRTVENILKNILTNQQLSGTYNKVVLNNHKGFVFLNKNNRLLNRKNFAYAMRRLRDTYNRKEKERSEKEKIFPIYMPAINPHVFRHTFCTRLCEVEANGARVMELMGHSDLSVTMNVYAEISKAAKKESLSKMEERFKTVI